METIQTLWCQKQNIQRHSHKSPPITCLIQSHCSTAAPRTFHDHTSALSVFQEESKRDEASFRAISYILN